MLDFDDCLKNPNNYIGLPIYVDYDYFSRSGYILSVYAHSITYTYYDYISNIERTGKIVRTNSNRVSILCDKVKIDINSPVTDRAERRNKNGTDSFNRL